jgi:glycosyltransferase involved in cell wall biosynthesis
LKSSLRKAKRALAGRKKTRSDIYTEAELARQRDFVFEKSPCFSIVVPLYNTPNDFLVEMINSVLASTYSNWELCLADGSDAEHAYVAKTCLDFAEKDSRIKYKKIEKNLGISGNSNVALEMATGDFIALFDHDDKLHPSALFEAAKAASDGADFIYTDEAKFSTHEKKDAYDFFFKPDFSPDTLRGYNYICHFTVFSRSLYEQVGGFRSAFDGSQDYDLILRLTEKAKKAVHIPKILYYWRCHAASVASDISAKPYTVTSAKLALGEHLERMGLEGEVLDSSFLSTYRIKYAIKGEPLVSVIIPNKDHADDLDNCLKSVFGLSTYKNFEVIVVENNSTEQATFDYYEQAQKEYANLRVVRWEHEFNYSKINNFGAQYAKGEYFILLNNDIEIITPEWIEEMLMLNQRDDVGISGMMLYYPDDTVQHAGVILGIGDVAGHSHKYFRRGESGYFYRMSVVQNYSAVTAAALMVRASVYHEVGGLEESFAVAFNDVDFCMKVRQAGYKVLWTPYAEAYHYESKSRGYENDKAKIKRFHSEIANFNSRWGDVLASGDPYYNPNLTNEREDFSFR